MAERIVKDSAGKEVVLQEGEVVVTTDAFIVVPGGRSRPGSNWLIGEIMDPYGVGGVYDESSLRIVPGGKNGRVTVIARPCH